MSKITITLLTGAIIAFGASGCGDNPMRLPPRPAAPPALAPASQQAQPNTALQAWYAGATVESSISEFPGPTDLQRVDFTHQYAADGTFVAVSRFTMRNPAQNFANQLAGVWSIRGDQLCSQAQQVDGRRVPPPGVAEACVRVEVEGEQVRLFPPDGSPTVIGRRVARQG